MRTDQPPLVLHVLDSLDGGGTQRALVALLERFDRRRFRHAVATLRDAGHWASRLPDDVACWALELKGRNRFAALQLAKGVRRLRPSMIHARNTCTWADVTMASCLSPHATLILGFHGLDHAGLFSASTRRIARLARFRGARFTAVSYSGTQRLTTELAIPAARVTTLLNGIDLKQYQPATVEERLAARMALGLDQTAFVAGWVGSLTSVKRPDVFIDALTEMPSTSRPIHAVLIGDGPLINKTKARTASSNLNERIRLLCACDDVRPHLAAFDVLVSSSDSEEMSNAVLEALACGVPVVGTDVGDTARMVGHEKGGIIVPKANSAALASAITTLMDGESLRQKLASGARARAEQFDLQCSARAYEQFYAAAVEKRPALDQPTHTPSKVMSSLCGAAPAKVDTCLRT